MRNYYDDSAVDVVVVVVAAGAAAADYCFHWFCSFCNDNHEIDTYLQPGPWGPLAMQMLNPPF